ncbi:GPW/gp25 family protein [Gallibacterium anatis]|uniref:Baseplate assembly protein W n=1 Tax=Gallibacterium anatis TaxID=750 RepID=A0A1A7P613_9PAST|nr:GPW/gp25 family protein [Gallibacterium anatis]OBW97166.1 baseplate assembly protein W [Gallibacterium anatis]OBW99310.1 baseplate assembly protein W [Gallibacterium anatis]
MDKKTGRYTQNETEHIKQSIQDILLTPIGSRLQRRDYGSHLFELIDRPISRALMLQLAAASVMAIKKWEPRIDIVRFAVAINPDTAQITADIEGVRKSDKKQLNFNDVTLGRNNERTGRFI